MHTRSSDTLPTPVVTRLGAGALLRQKLTIAGGVGLLVVSGFWLTLAGFCAYMQQVHDIGGWSLVLFATLIAGAFIACGLALLFPATEEPTGSPFS